MNILHLVFSFNNGGIENLIIDSVNNWGSSNDNIILCIINDDYNDRLIEKINISDKIQVIKLNRVKGEKNLSFLWEFIKIIYKNNIHIIHSHLYDAVKIAIIAKLLFPKIRLIYTVHDTKIYTMFKKRDLIIHNIFVDKIIAISEAVYREILLKNKKVNKVDLVRNGIDINKFKSANQKSGNYIKVGCTARILPAKKGQDILINAIAKVKIEYPNIQCYLAGEPMKGHENYLVDLKNQVKALNLEENIIFLGNVDDIPSFLAMLDIFVLPSRYEGFGIAIIEAMASRVPVIASKLEGPQEIIKNNMYGYLFEIEDVEELAKLIIYYIETDMSQHVEKAYDYVKNNFDIKIINKSLRNIYCKGKKDE